MGKLNMEPNADIRMAIETKRIRMYELANAMKVNRQTVYRWLRDDSLSEDRKEKLWAAIAKIC